MLSHGGLHIVRETTRVMNNLIIDSKTEQLEISLNRCFHIEEVSTGRFSERSKHCSDRYWTRCHDGQHKAGSHRR